MNKEVLKNSLKDIGINLVSIHFLNAGTTKRSYIIKDNKKKYILKLFEKRKKKNIQKQVTLLRKINSKEQVSIIPIHKRVLVIGDEVGYVYEFVGGKLYGSLRIKNRLYNFGKIVGRFNKFTKDFSLGRKQEPPVKSEIMGAKESLKSLSGELDFGHRRAKRVLENAIKVLDEDYKKTLLRTQIIHGDLHDNNVLYDNNKTIVIDMDGIGESILAREISTFISYFSSRSLDKYEIEVKKFISGYESEYKLTRREKAIMPILLIIRKIGEINYILKQERKKALSKSEVKFFLGHTTRKLSFILKNYLELKKIFKRI